MSPDAGSAATPPPRARRWRPSRRRAARCPDSPKDRRITLTFVRPGSVNEALELLRMARKLDRYRASARMALEPWLVEAALSRLGDRRLSREEQATVVQATRTPGRVRWPAWW